MAGNIIDWQPDPAHDGVWCYLEGRVMLSVVAAEVQGDHWSLPPLSKGKHLQNVRGGKRSWRKEKSDIEAATP